MDRQPINYGALTAAVELALNAHDDISKATAQEVLEAVETAVEANSALMCREDYDEFMSILDGVLDSIDGNGYGEQVTELDRIRGRLESEQQASSADATAAAVSQENTDD